MDPHDLLTTLRAANVAIFALGCAGFTWSVVDTWPQLARGRRWLMCSYVGVLGTAAVGSAIKYLAQIPPDPSVALLTVCGITLHVGLWLARHEDQPL